MAHVATSRAAKKPPFAAVVQRVEEWLLTRVEQWVKDGGDSCNADAALIAKTRGLCFLLTVRSVVDVNAVPWPRLVDALLQACFPDSAKDIVPLRWTRHSDTSKDGTCVTFEGDVYPTLKEPPEKSPTSQLWWGGLARLVGCEIQTVVKQNVRRNASEAAEDGKMVTNHLKMVTRQFRDKGDALGERRCLFGVATYIYGHMFACGTVRRSDPVAEIMPPKAPAAPGSVKALPAKAEPVESDPAAAPPKAPAAPVKALPAKAEPVESDPAAAPPKAPAAPGSVNVARRNNGGASYVS
jgi:hypothetical protein